ncbi:hypothetical protein An03g02410 [Aspergillus niger]|uniref:Uncharacterized protein n=2 Tax=Aspergillus niger TaxID=5061 RepID=A2QG99_ASPNC|nr:hypothetical protein An03g02410 [Aspergillus niger]CAK38209.1 hypothetical protein An03g02410 [Aspergillus niger]
MASNDKASMSHLCCHIDVVYELAVECETNEKPNHKRMDDSVLMKQSTSVDFLVERHGIHITTGQASTPHHPLTPLFATLRLTGQPEELSESF